MCLQMYMWTYIYMYIYSHIHTHIRQCISLHGRRYIDRLFNEHR